MMSMIFAIWWYFQANFFTQLNPVASSKQVTTKIKE